MWFLLMGWVESSHGLAVRYSDAGLLYMDAQAKELKDGLWSHRDQVRQGF